MGAADLQDLLGFLPSLRSQTEQARDAGVTLEEARATMAHVATECELAPEPFLDLVDDVYGVAETARALSAFRLAIANAPLAGFTFGLEPNTDAIDDPEAEPTRVVALKGAT